MSLSVAMLISLSSLIAVAVAVFIVARMVNGWRRAARAAGYSGLSEYLRSAPRSDQERKDSVDMALKGFIICVVGLLFPPLLLIGAFPLFFGGRKIAYWAVGLGVYEDVGQPDG
jgi:hypothetical protein